MKNLFNMDNPVFQTLSRIADLAVLSVICLLCCLPVVTIGPALVALNKTVYDLTIDRGGSILRTYFRAFRSNLRQGMIAGMFGLLALAALVCDFLLLRLYYTGNAYTLLVCLIYVLGFLVAGVLSYMLPLIGRYENKLSQHFQNALILSIRYLPKTIAMVFLHILPLLLALDGRRLAKRDRDLELGQLQARFTAPELVGRLALAANLIDRCVPITPRELLPLFSWEKLPRGDLTWM